MSEFYFTILGSIINIAIPYLITRRDRRRLGPEQLAGGKHQEIDG